MAARNVLLTHDMKAKIADFGLSTRIYFNTTERKGPVENMVPIHWAALEVLQGRAAIIEYSDVWSYGVFIWEIFYMGSAVPYGDKKEFEEILDILQKGHRLSKPPMCPKYTYNLMLDCWHANELSLGRRSGNTSNQNKYLFLLKYLNHSQIVLKHFSLFSLIGIEIEIEIVL